MLKIKAIPLERHVIIPTAELKSSVHANKYNKPAFRPKDVIDEHEYLIGTPYFNLNFKKDTRQFIPVGQYRTALRLFKKTHGRSSMVAGLKLEYRSIVKALVHMKIKFRVVDLERGDRETGRRLREYGCSSLRLPYKQVVHWQIFPRDMCVYVKDANIILVHSKLFKIPSPLLNGCRVFHTGWGEGGRVLLSGNHMILGLNQEAGRRVRESEVISILRDRGMKVAFVPYALFYGLSPRGERKFLFHHSHIDLSASLFKGKDGGFHLIIDPAYRTGPLSDPLSVEKSLDLVKQNCAEIDVEVHAPRKSLTIPFSTAMVQFENGKVLATCGDDDVLSTVADIAGSENIKVADIPIVQYPLFGGAGLHCLITENPLPLLSPVE